MRWRTEGFLGEFGPSGQSGGDFPIFLCFRYLIFGRQYLKNLKGIEF